MVTRTDARRALEIGGLAVLFTVAALTIACNSPTAPQTVGAQRDASSIVLGDAQVVFNGEVVNGRTLHAGELPPAGLLFRATLTGADGASVPGLAVRVRYEFPSMGGMMSRGGYLTLFDDGTHGDPDAGDGVYCFEDGSDPLGFHIGFHMPDAPHGLYRYDFFGVDAMQRHSNQVTVEVTLASD